MQKAKLLKILFVLLALSVHFSGTAQTGTALVTTIFNQFATELGYKIAYDPTAVQGLESKIPTPQLRKSLLFDVCVELNLEIKEIGDKQFLIRKKAVDEKKAEQWLRLSGTVEDSKDKFPLIGAVLFSDSEHFFGQTDENGKFEIAIPLGQFHDEKICIQYLGYNNVCQPIKDISKGEQLNFELEPQIFDVAPITVSSVVVKIAVDNAEIMLKDDIPELVKRSSSPFGSDPLRSLHLLSGVNATNDKSSDISIRAGDYEETMLSFQGIPLFHTKHMNGFLSVLNPLVAEDLKVYKNAVPIQLVERTGGLVMASLDEFGNTPFSGQLELNNFTGNARLDTKIGDKTNILVAGRTVWNQLSPQSTFIEQPEEDDDINSVLDPLFSFNDFNFSVKHQISEGNTLQADVFVANDRYTAGLDLLEREIEDVDINRGLDIEEIKNSFGYNISHQMVLNPKWEINTNFASSQSSQESFNSILTVFRTRNGERTRQIEYNQFNEIRQNSLKTYFKYKPHSKRELFLGAYFDTYGVDFGYNLNNVNYWHDTDSEANLIGLFGQWNEKIGFNTLLSAGIRTKYYNLSEQFHSSYFATLQHRINPQFLLKSSFSRSVQFLRQANHIDISGNSNELWLLANQDDFPILTATQFMLGFHFKTNGGWLFDAEIFSRNNSGLISNRQENYAVLDSLDRDDLDIEFRIFEGESKTFGTELTLQKRNKNSFHALVYNFNEKQERYDGLFREAWFDAFDNRKHQFKLLNTFDFNNWSFSINGIFGSDIYVLDVEQADRKRNIRDYDIDDLYEPIGAYLRMDLGLQYRFAFKKNNVKASLNVFNALNTANFSTRQFLLNPDLNGQVGENLLSFNSELLGRSITFGVHLAF